MVAGSACSWCSLLCNKDSWLSNAFKQFAFNFLFKAKHIGILNIVRSIIIGTLDNDEQKNTKINTSDHSTAWSLINGIGLVDL